MSQLMRQGDIVFECDTDRDLSSATPVQRDSRGRIVLAYGEVTGHAHVVLDTHVRCVQTSDGLFLVNDAADKPIVIRHEEHGAITIPSGVRTVQVYRQREWTDANEPRIIAD